MKIVVDKSGRKMYKFRHSVCQGGYLYSRGVVSGEILNKSGLKLVLDSVVNKFDLIDVTIKIYKNIFFIFYMVKPSVVLKDLFDTIDSVISSFGNWNKDYVVTNVYDLQEKYVREDLLKLGFDYDNKNENKGDIKE